MEYVNHIENVQNLSFIWGPVIAAAISGVSSLVSAWRNKKTAKENTDKTIAFNLEQARQKYENDKKMWQERNEYNDPSAQMERLKAAGLNPNLVYSSGQVTGNTVGQSPEYSKTEGVYNYKPMDYSLGDAVNTYQNVRQQTANIDNIQEQTAMTKQKRQNEVINNAILMKKNKLKQIDLERASSILPYQKDAARLDVDKKRIDIENSLKSGKLMDKNLSVKQQEFEYNVGRLLDQKFDLELRKLGMNRGDSLLMRLFVRWYSSTRDWKNATSESLRDALRQWKKVQPELVEPFKYL